MSPNGLKSGLLSERMGFARSSQTLRAALHCLGSMLQQCEFFSNIFLSRSTESTGSRLSRLLLGFFPGCPTDLSGLAELRLVSRRAHQHSIAWHRTFSA